MVDEDDPPAQRPVRPESDDSADYMLREIETMILLAEMSPELSELCLSLERVREELLRTIREGKGPPTRH